MFKDTKEQGIEAVLAVLNERHESLAKMQAKLCEDIEKMATRFNNFSFETREALQQISIDVRQEMAEIRVNNRHLANQIKIVEILQERLDEMEDKVQSQSTALEKLTSELERIQDSDKVEKDTALLLKRHVYSKALDLLLAIVIVGGLTFAGVQIIDYTEAPEKRMLQQP